jgi:hypothetical protein
MFGDSPAKNTVYTTYIYGSGQPYSSAVRIQCLLLHLQLQSGKVACKRGTGAAIRSHAHKASRAARIHIHNHSAMHIHLHNQITCAHKASSAARIHCLLLHLQSEIMACKNRAKSFCAYGFFLPNILMAVVLHLQLEYACCTLISVGREACFVSLVHDREC